jgi:hypothetical protein
MRECVRFSYVKKINKREGFEWVIKMVLELLKVQSVALQFRYFSDEEAESIGNEKSLRMY